MQRVANRILYHGFTVQLVYGEPNRRVQLKGLGTRSEVPFELRLGQADANGHVVCRFPRANISPAEWEVYAAGQRFVQDMLFGFGDGFFSEVELRRFLLSDFGRQTPSR